MSIEFVKKVLSEEGILDFIKDEFEVLNTLEVVFQKTSTFEEVDFAIIDYAYKHIYVKV